MIKELIALADAITQQTLETMRHTHLLAVTNLVHKGVDFYVQML